MKNSGAAGRDHLGERLGLPAELRTVEQGRVANHPQVVVADHAAQFGELHRRAYHAADERIGEIDEAVFTLVAAGHERADVLELGGVAQPGHALAAINGRQHSLQRRFRVAAHVQVRPRIGRHRRNGPVGRGNLHVIDAQDLAGRADGVRPRLGGRVQEAVHAEPEQLGLLDGEQQRHVGSLAEIEVAARQRHFLHDHIVERPRERIGLDCQLGLHSFAGALRLGRLRGLGEKMVAPQVAHLAGLQQFAQRVELHEVLIVGHAQR